MLAAQAEVQRVAPAMHDQMDTEEMKKRGREANTDDIDADGEYRSYVPAVGQSQPQDQVSQPHEAPPPPPYHLPYPSSEVGIHGLNPDHAARLAAELASAASTNISLPQSHSHQQSIPPPVYVPRVPIVPAAPPAPGTAPAVCTAALAPASVPYLPYGCSPPPGYPQPYPHPQSAQLATALAMLAQQGFAIDPTILASAAPPNAAARPPRAVLTRIIA